MVSICSTSRLFASRRSFAPASERLSYQCCVSLSIQTSLNVLWIGAGPGEAGPRADAGGGRQQARYDADQARRVHAAPLTGGRIGSPPVRTTQPRDVRPSPARPSTVGPHRSALSRACDAHLDTPPHPCVSALKRACPASASSEAFDYAETGTDGRIELAGSHWSSRSSPSTSRRLCRTRPHWGGALRAKPFVLESLRNTHGSTTRFAVVFRRGLECQLVQRATTPIISPLFAHMADDASFDEGDSHWEIRCTRRPSRRPAS